MKFDFNFECNGKTLDTYTVEAGTLGEAYGEARQLAESEYPYHAITVINIMRDDEQEKQA